MIGLPAFIASVATKFLADGLLDKLVGSNEQKKTVASQVIEKILAGGFAGADLNNVIKLFPDDIASKINDSIKIVFGGDGTLTDELIKKIEATCLGSVKSHHGVPGNRRFADTDDFEVPDDPAVKAIVGNAKLWLVYRIQNPDALKQLKHVGDKAEEIIDEAFRVWQRVIFLRILKTDEAVGQVNLDIVVNPLDGQGGKLAEAIVGNGPAGTDQPYQLAIDSNEDWTEQKFLFAIVHEIGHLLGLEHNENAGDVMNSLAPSDPATVLAFSDDKVEFKNTASLSITQVQTTWGKLG